MEQNTVYVDGLPVGIDWGAGDDIMAFEKLAIDCADAEPQDATTGRKPTHVIFDEWEGLQRQLRLYAAATLAASPFMQQLGEMVSGWDLDCVWSCWRTRNLSHRPVAGARKRKAALKQAARTRRAAVAERRY